MSNSTALITEMGILVGIFLLGLLAKLFPKKQGTGIREQGSGGGNRAGVQRSAANHDCELKKSTAVNH
jgi:hypothetical protein